MGNICFLSRWRQKTLICLSLFGVCVSTISEAAGPPPVITVQPLDQTVPKGGTAIFTVVAVSGTTLSYTWFKGNQKMAGQTARILTINNVGPMDANVYYVAVKNAGGTVTSRTATLIIGIPDTVSPTNGITSPTANQGWSNAVFTVTGAARDNVGVANVFLSLNGGGWTPATTANGWTNWSAQVSLTPGTNTVQAYAVDPAGNASTTNSVKFVYILTAPLTVAPLTVNIVGGGTVVTNYNNQLLQIGAPYAMTAKTNTGFAFVHWTDGDGNVLTTGATLQFVMASNLTFTASFVDVATPTNGITSPTANQRWSNAVFTVTGAARDNVGVANVFLSLNGGGWTPAITANGWTNWSAQVSLTPGTNTVQACAVDVAGNVSTTNTVKFVYILIAPLTVNIVGGGTVVTNYNNQLLQIGASYAMTARTNTGFAFVHWTDGDGNVLTNGATLQFVMASNLTFTASFVDVAAPTNGITSPTANQRWSNAVFTVTGAARDNVGVANVFLSLNGGGWTPAITANGWTNWSAQVSLTPGTNTVQACAVDAAGNVSTTNTVKFVYVTVDWAPGSLNGLVATITPDGQSTFHVGFWTNTFSQSSTDTNNNNGVGTYSYTKLNANTARLVIAYTSPPTITNDNASVFLTFTSNNTCTFSNEINGVDLGAITFSASANLLPASFNGIKAIFIDSTGGQTAFSFSGNSITITNSQGQVKTGTYTSKQYSQVGAMIVVVQSPKTIYLELTFTTTNYGAYFVTTFDNSGNLPDTDSGVFVRPSQSAGGNAPSALTGTNALVTEEGSSFLLSLGATTFTQTAKDTNGNNGAGTYTYIKLVNKNIKLVNNTAQLAISYATPPTITNEGGSMFLTFVAPNFCLFTNRDDSGSNYIATISFSAATNLVPASLAGHTVTATGLNGVVDAVTFNGDGTFTQTETRSGNPGVSTGTYTFTTYSLIGGMLRLNFTVGGLTGIAYVQTTFVDNSDGTFFSTFYDSLSDPPSTAAGTFTIH